MANKLKIYACSGIGNAQPKQDLAIRYWTADTVTVQNTQAVNTLLARINNYYIAANRLEGISPDEKIEMLNEIDWMCVALEAAKRFKDDEQLLYHAGTVISSMIENGDFETRTLDERKRADHLDELIERANNAFDDETEIPVTNQWFMDMWKRDIMDRNRVGLTVPQQKTAEQELKAAIKKIKAIKGIGDADPAWMENADLGEYLTKGGTYFIYLFFTDEQLQKLPESFYKKRKLQEQTYHYCKQLFVDVYGSEEEMVEIIRAGIYDRAKKTPEYLCEMIASGKKVDGIGFVFLGLTGAAAVTAFISFLGVLAGLIAAVVKAICEMVYKTNVAKYGAIDQAAVQAGVPTDEDYEGMSWDSVRSSSSWLLPAALGVAAILLFRK